MPGLIKHNLIFLTVFIGLFLCGTHVTTAQVKKVAVPTVQKAKTPGLHRGHQVQKESSAGTKPDNEIAEAAIKAKADALAAKYLVNGSGGVGLVIGVIDGDRRMILAYGETVRGNGQKPRTNTIFQIGSITKVFTATLLAIYAEKNVVDYNDPLQKYVRSDILVPTKGGQQITLLDLATHYSGLPRTLTTSGPTSVDQAYHILETSKPLLSIPGDTWAYSNLGFGFLALAVADAASNPQWASLVQKDIAEPLNLVDTKAVLLNVTPPTRAAQGYTKAGNPTESTMPGWPALGGAGELYSTPDDMMKFLSFNMGLTETPLNSLLPDLHKSWRPVTGQPGRTQGLGWNIYETKTRTIWKNGTTPGFHSYIGFCKGKKSGVFVLSNSLQLNSTNLGQVLLGFLTGDPQLEPGTPDDR